MLHPTASHISVKHSPKQDTGGSSCQLIIEETNRKEGAVPNPSLYRKLTEYSETRLQESGHCAADWDTSTRNQKHGGERSARHMFQLTASHIFVKHTPRHDKERSIFPLIQIEPSNTEGNEMK